MLNGKSFTNALKDAGCFREMTSAVGGPDEMSKLLFRIELGHVTAEEALTDGKFFYYEEMSEGVPYWIEKCSTVYENYEKGLDFAAAG